MANFKLTVEYAGLPLEIETDDFLELHAAAARILELNTQVVFLRSRGAKDPRPYFKHDKDGNAYYSLRCARTRMDASFGQNKDKTGVPLFPRWDEGFWKPEAAPEEPEVSDVSSVDLLGVDCIDELQAGYMWQCAKKAGYTPDGFAHMLQSLGYQRRRDVPTSAYEVVLALAQNEAEASRFNAKPGTP